jgi:phosphotransferase system  glucose/maltose/N-acetylglucosamine-specific IIC component
MQRIIGIILGGLTIYLLLNVMEALTKDTQPRYLLAIIIGMLVALLYPWIIGIFLVRRHRAKQDEEIQAEVQRQLAEERAKTNQG